MKKIAVILSGCGYLDGSEIRESVLTLLALENNEFDYEIFAPNIKQLHVVNHLNVSEQSSDRNVLNESARIARGEVKDLELLEVKDFNGLIIPGGFGVAKNLSNFAFKGSASTVNQELSEILKAFHQQKKPIGAICISPVLLALTFGKLSPKITLGSDFNIAEEIEKTGARHIVCATTECVVDKENLFITTPAYMDNKATIKEINIGISKLVQELKMIAN